MIAKLKAFFAWSGSKRTVAVHDLTMFAILLFGEASRETVKTIQAVQADTHGAAYWHAFMAVALFGWTIECIVRVKGDPTA